MTFTGRGEPFGVLSTFALESEALRLVVVPDLGGRVVSLRDRRNGREWLVQAPPPHRGELSSWSGEDAVFGAAEAAGWDECLPTVARCPDPSAPSEPALRDHGALWGRAAAVRAFEEDGHPGLLTSWVDPRWQLEVERRIRLEGDVLHLSYGVSNTKPQPVALLWSMHALLDLEPGARIEMGTATPFVVSSALGCGSESVRMAEVHQWPLLEWGEGRRDLSIADAPGAGWAAKVYADPGPTTMRAINPDGSSISFHQPGSPEPAFGLWLDYGGWPAPMGVRQVAIEPATSGHDDLGGAMRDGRALTLAPGASANWEVQVEVRARSSSPARSRVRARPASLPAKVDPAPYPLPLPRTEFGLPDGRSIRVYGQVRGAPPTDAPCSEPTALHMRFDSLSSSWIGISPSRNARPHSTQASASGMAPGSPAERHKCPLCPGGPELAFSYEAAVFDNRFPTFVADPPPVPDPGNLLMAPSQGKCEVVMFTERHEGNFATLTPAETARVIAVLKDRTAALWTDPANRYVMPFESRGGEVGATLSHPHGQIYAFDHLPPQMERRAAALASGRAHTGACLSCAVVAEELASERIIHADPHWSVGIPFAPRWPFEVHVRAKRHGARRLADLTDAESRALARALHVVVERYNGLFGFELPYMMIALEAPADAPDWHFAVEFYPPHRSEKLTKVRASVETATLLFINDTLPETSAARLQACPITPFEEHPGYVVVPADGQP
jgi:UDPglucose--hexose-1-phosphate uridylyltransferase